MNALTIGSYAAIALMGILVLYKLYKLVKAEGASQQKVKDEEAINEWLKENAPDIYNNFYGIDALSVSGEDAWGENSGSRAKIRIISNKEADGARNTGGDSD